MRKKSAFAEGLAHGRDEEPKMGQGGRERGGPLR